MARYHAIVNGGTIPVYGQSDCNPSTRKGELYNGEVFTCLGETSGYMGVDQVKFLDPNGKYSNGWIETGSYGNLVYSGTKQNMSSLGTCYCFRLRRSLEIVSTSNGHKTNLAAGNMVYSVGATAGQSDPRNMAIIGYNQNGKIVKYNGFVKLDYTGGSMFAKNFCLKK